MITEKTYLDQLRTYLGARYSPDTVRTFLVQSHLFMSQAGVKADYTRADILAYVDHQIGQRKARKSIETAVASIRALFRAMGWTWPLSRPDMHLSLPAQENQGPVMPKDDVLALIRSVKGMETQERMVVALSTTYGLRPAELTQILNDGCDGQLLVVQTAKGGARRHHVVPRELQDILNFPPIQVSRETLHIAFRQTMFRHVRPPRHREGWHSIRRSLVTELLNNGVEMHTVSRFMGWKMPDTAFGYYRPQGNQVDQQIFEKHPFLEAWR